MPKSISRCLVLGALEVILAPGILWCSEFHKLPNDWYLIEIPRTDTPQLGDLVTEEDFLNRNLGSVNETLLSGATTQPLPAADYRTSISKSADISALARIFRVALTGGELHNSSDMTLIASLPTTEKLDFGVIDNNSLARCVRLPKAVAGTISDRHTMVVTDIMRTASLELDFRSDKQTAASISVIPVAKVGYSSHEQQQSTATATGSARLPVLFKAKHWDPPDLDCLEFPPSIEMTDVYYEMIIYNYTDHPIQWTVTPSKGFTVFGGGSANNSGIAPANTLSHADVIYTPNAKVKAGTLHFQARNNNHQSVTIPVIAPELASIPVTSPMRFRFTLKPGPAQWTAEAIRKTYAGDYAKAIAYFDKASIIEPALANDIIFLESAKLSKELESISQNLPNDQKEALLTIYRVDASGQSPGTIPSGLKRSSVVALRSNTSVWQHIESVLGESAHSSLAFVEKSAR